MRPACSTGTRKYVYNIHESDQHLEDCSQWKKGSVLHINFKTSIVHNLICKVYKHVVLGLRLDSMAVCMLLSATLQYQKYLYLRSFYFRNFANGSERKGLSAFTSKFPSSAAGLHLVLKTSCLRKKPDLSNRTVRQSNPIEHQSFDCQTQSNIIELTIKFCQSNTMEHSVTERVVKNC